MNMNSSNYTNELYEGCRDKERNIELYWVSMIEQTDSGLLFIGLSNRITSYDDALKEIKWQRENRNIVSAWIDTFKEIEGKQEKNVVFMECYLDYFGNIVKP